MLAVLNFVARSSFACNSLTHTHHTHNTQTSEILKTELNQSRSKLTLLQSIFVAFNHH